MLLIQPQSPSSKTFIALLTPCLVFPSTVHWLLPPEVLSVVQLLEDRASDSVVLLEAEATAHHEERDVNLEY